MSKFWEKFKNILKALVFSYNEYLPMIAALVLWWFSSIVTRIIDPTAAVDDAGLVQALLFGLVLYFTALAAGWFSLRTAFPKIGKFLDDDMGELFAEMETKTKVLIAIALFAVHFIGAVVIFAMIV